MGRTLTFINIAAFFVFSAAFSALAQPNRLQVEQGPLVQQSSKGPTAVLAQPCGQGFHRQPHTSSNPAWSEAYQCVRPLQRSCRPGLIPGEVHIGRTQVYYLCHGGNSGFCPRYFAVHSASPVRAYFCLHEGKHCAPSYQPLPSYSAVPGGFAYICVRS